MTKYIYKSELERFLSNKIFMWSLVVIALVCYGYSAVNTTISIDDMNGDYYLGSGNVMLSSGRFGMVLWSKLIGFGDFMPPYTFAIEVLAVVFLLWATINFCILFERITKNKVAQGSLYIFALLSVSYPLINEIWEYSAANLFIGGGFLCVSFIMLLLQEMIEEKKICMFQLLVAYVLIVVVASSYESIVVVYIFAVTAALFLAVVYEPEAINWKSMFTQIGIYVAFLFAGIVGRVVVDKILLMVFKLEDITNGATQILWGTATFGEIFENLKDDIINTYILRALVYFPLAELMVAIAIMCVAIVVIVVKQKSVKILLPGVGALVSLIALSLLQGNAAPYRTCQVFGIFVGFCGLLLLEAVKGKRYLKTVCTCAMVVLAVQQAVYLSYFLNLNHLRSEEEVELLREIGEELAIYDRSKPVIFLGEYSLSDYIVQASSVEKESREWYWYARLYAKFNDLQMIDVYENGNRKIVSTNVKSMINWAAEPSNGQGVLRKTFWYLGYDYKTVDNPDIFLSAYYTACAQVQSYWDNVGDLNWKNSYAVLETEDYVIVHFR